MVEKTYYLLLCRSDLEEVMRGICSAFGTAYSGGGNTYQARSGDVQINLSAVTGKMEGEAQEFFKNQLDGIWGHFRQVETEKADIKVNILHQIRMSGCLCIANCSWEEQDGGQKEQMVRERLAAIIGVLGGLLLTERGREVYDGELQMLFSISGTSEVEAFYPYDTYDAGEGPAEYREALDRRVRSLAFLRERHIFSPGWLPLLPGETEAACREPREIALRAACLMAVALHGECLCSKAPVAEAGEYSGRVLEAFGCRDALSPRERAFLENKAPEERESVQFSWQYECLAVMVWALGLGELPFPDGICDVRGLAKLMREHDSVETLLEAATPRSPGELLDAADLIYRLDWACVDARVNGLAAPHGMDGGVVVERHKALNWLIGDNDSAEWDDVDTST